MKNETILFFYTFTFFGLIENVLIILQCNAKQKGIEISSKRKAKRKKTTNNKKKYRKQAENFSKRKFSFSFQKISY